MNLARPLTHKEMRKIAGFKFEGKYAVRNSSLFKLMCLTGGRISELLDLDVDDVWRNKIPRATLKFTRTINPRAIPLNYDAQMAIRELITYKKRMGEDISPDAQLFISRQKRRPCRQQIGEILAVVFNKCRIKGNISTHSIRKGFGIELLRLGLPLPEVQYILGHTRMRGTRRYLGIPKEKVKDVKIDPREVINKLRFLPEEKMKRGGKAKAK